ncbi:hypothetical protein GA830_10385 [Mesorhizobium sp. NBSH29]|uniref:hypothetical protein n=1 Tax=Mesorhizobium sp. NBSH29 TaxID=2654249 RepID=UPI0018969643|nr:hypothetical protein [Mesorhizobium sp. NBSH29]QPC87102.1 hypothetical protein GA830_10385 [Mesorhizobium sp. NBSH29]
MNNFQEWMEKMGFNRKQVSEAGALIGFRKDLASLVSRGARELSETERLALAAVRAGLPAWTPETDAAIADVGAVQRIIERAVARQEPSSSASASEESKAA